MTDDDGDDDDDHHHHHHYGFFLVFSCVLGCSGLQFSPAKGALESEGLS